MTQQSAQQQPTPVKRAQREAIASGTNALYAMSTFYTDALNALLQESQGFEKGVQELMSHNVAMTTLLTMDDPPEIPSGLPPEHVGQWALSWVQANRAAIQVDAQNKTNRLATAALVKEALEEPPKEALEEPPKEAPQE